MKVLGFKKWYESKLENESVPVRSNNLLESIGGNIFKFPKRMLQLEMDIVGENSIGKKSKNPILRYLIDPQTEDLKKLRSSLKSIIDEGRANGRHFYILGFDFTSNDRKKCFKGSLKVAENFKSLLDILKDLPVRGMGRIEQINENYHSQIPSSLLRQRVELVECFFDPNQIPEQIEIPFYFNPNDYTLLEKYEGCLRGILFQSILRNENFKMRISAVKPWTTSKKIPLNKLTKQKEDSSIIYEMKYLNPKKSSLVNPENKPEITNIKITVKEITEKRADSVIKYLSDLTTGMPIEYISEGIGYKEGNQTLGISII